MCSNCSVPGMKRRALYEFPEQHFRVSTIIISVLWMGKLRSERIKEVVQRHKASKHQRPVSIPGLILPKFLTQTVNEFLEGEKP